MGLSREMDGLGRWEELTHVCVCVCACAGLMLLPMMHTVLNLSGAEVNLLCGPGEFV